MDRKKQHTYTIPKLYYHQRFAETFFCSSNEANLLQLPPFCQNLLLIQSRSMYNILLP